MCVPCFKKYKSAQVQLSKKNARESKQQKALESKQNKIALKGTSQVCDNASDKTNSDQKLSNSKSKSQVKLKGNCQVKKTQNKDKIDNNSADK